MMNKLFLTAGHNGAGTGAKKYLDEGAETIKLRNDLKHRLELNGVQVIADNDSQPLAQVIAAIKSKMTFNDYVIDLHFNAGGGTGVEAFTNNNPTAEESRLASDMCMTVSRVLGIRNRGVKKESQSNRGKLGILQLNAQTVLLEVCFVDSQDDADEYRAKYYELVEELAEIIAKNVK